MTTAKSKSTGVEAMSIVELLKQAHKRIIQLELENQLLKLELEQIKRAASTRNTDSSKES